MAEASLSRVSHTFAAEGLDCCSTPGRHEGQCREFQYSVMQIEVSGDLADGSDINLHMYESPASAG